jgi:hypothetical protein
VRLRRDDAREARPAGPVLRVIGEGTDEAPTAGVVRPVTGRIGGHRFELYVWPPGRRPNDPEVIGTEAGCWVKLRFV